MRVRAPEPGSAPVQAVLCPRPSAAGAGTREEGARGSAYLPLLTDKSRSVQRLARACLAADPGKPGAARSTPSRASAARLAELAQRKALSTAAGPARLAAGPRAAARVPPARLSEARGEAGAQPAPGTPARSLARGAAEPATATRLRAPPMSSFTAIVFGEIAEPGREVGVERRREQEGSPCSRPRDPATPWSRAARGEGTGAARPPPVRPAGTEAGGALGQRGRGWGRRGAGPGRVRGVGDPERVEEPPPADTRARSWRRRWKEPPAAAACARGYTAARPRGLWAAGGAAPPGNLLSPPWSCLWSSRRVGNPAFSPGRGRWGPLEMAVCCATWLSPVWL